MAPATCRVEPRHITTFDNVTYSYNIPECEHVLMMDQQKATLNMAPATCRVEPRHITTFDSVTYSYNIPECEHVLMMDGTLTYPVAVLAQKQSGQEMIVKVIAGKDQIQIGSKSRGIELLVNNRHVTIRPGQKIEQYSQESGYPTGKRLVATVRRYTSEEVYHVSVQQYSQESGYPTGKRLV